MVRARSSSRKSKNKKKCTLDKLFKRINKQQFFISITAQILHVSECKLVEIRQVI